MFPIKYIDNNLVWNKDNEVFAYYELIPYNYSFLKSQITFALRPKATYAGKAVKLEKEVFSEPVTAVRSVMYVPD